MNAQRVGALGTAGGLSHDASPLLITGLAGLMVRTCGVPDISIGLIDGPVATGLDDLAPAYFQVLASGGAYHCSPAPGSACTHGTFVAAILAARRVSQAPAICPGCSLLSRPIFADSPAGHGAPSVSPDALAESVLECVRAGARILNISLALSHASVRAERRLEDALTLAMGRGVLVVAAAGNESEIGGSAITRHPWVIPVTACDHRGRPLSSSNFGASIGQQGIAAPGLMITSLSPSGAPTVLSGTSVAAPFVTGAIALLWGEFPKASAAQVRDAVAPGRLARRRGLFPPLLDVASAELKLRLQPRLAA